MKWINSCVLWWWINETDVQPQGWNWIKPRSNLFLWNNIVWLYEGKGGLSSSSTNRPTGYNMKWSNSCMIRWWISGIWNMCSLRIVLALVSFHTADFSLLQCSRAMLSAVLAITFSTTPFKVSQLIPHDILSISRLQLAVFSWHLQWTHMKGAPSPRPSSTGPALGKRIGAFQPW